MREEGRSAAFDPQTVRIVNSAYADALSYLLLLPWVKGQIDELTARVELAKALVDLARHGERDRSSLKQKALLRLSTMAGNPNREQMAS